MYCGFIGMGLSEFLKMVEVFKGFFYYYFCFKEVFGVVLFEYYYIGYLQCLVDYFDYGDGNYCDCLLVYYQYMLNQFCQQGIISGCFIVKLFVEVCDLLEDMCVVMDCGVSQIIVLLGDVLEKGCQEGSIVFDGEVMILLQVLYFLWFGVNLQVKIMCSVMLLESVFVYVKQIIVVFVV